MHAPASPEFLAALDAVNQASGRAAGSSVSYSYFGAEARHNWALGSDVTLAWHAAARYMPSAANAPFWALSRLGGSLQTSVPAPFSHLHSAAGLSVRVVASPFVVGYVDVGFAHGKAAVFSGINYPF
ncbi:MAG TPA: hypothetical protein VGD47_05300 [Steroidobacteraceae bacterium]